MSQATTRHWPEPEVEEPDRAEECSRVLLMNENAATSCEEGCEVEPDGVCPHGHPAWVLRWGLL